MTKSAALYWPSPCEPCIVKWQFILLEHLGNKDIQLTITGDSFVIVLCCGSTMHSWLCIQTLEQLSRRTSKNLLHARLSSSPTCRASFRVRSRCERKCWCLANLLEQPCLRLHHLRWSYIRSCMDILIGQQHMHNRSAHENTWISLSWLCLWCGFVGPHNREFGGCSIGC